MALPALVAACGFDLVPAGPGGWGCWWGFPLGFALLLGGGFLALHHVCRLDRVRGRVRRP